VGGEQFRGLGDDQRESVAVNDLDQGLACREVPVEGADPAAGVGGDRLPADRLGALGDRGPCRLEEQLPVSLGVRADARCDSLRGAGDRRLGDGMLGNHKRRCLR
jgi:hypothetical protein